MAKIRITKKDVVHAASLARLKLSEEEIDKFGTELAMILDFVAKLEEVDIKNIESTNYGGLGGDSFREDVPLTFLEEKVRGTSKKPARPTHDVQSGGEVERKRLTDAFPDSQDGMLKVPHVLSKEDLL